MRKSLATRRSPLAAAIILVTLAAGCARGGSGAPEARLGKYPEGPYASTASISRGGSSHGPGAASIAGDNDTVYFVSDSAELTPEALQSLTAQARALKSVNGQLLTVEGHADERGTREYNIALGARRAEAVKRFLVSQGIHAGSLRTVSYGKERPVAVCNDISCWSQNRRAQTIMAGLIASRR